MKIAITHMSSDRNKGDFAILAATVAAFRRASPGCELTAISAELARADGARAETRLTRSLGVDIVPTPVPSRRALGRGSIRWVARLFAAEISLAAVRIAGRRAVRYLPAPDRRLFECFYAADLVVAKGGSYLHSRGGPNEVLYLLRMLYPLRAALAARRPLRVLGVSVGPFRPRPMAGIAARVLRRCKSIHVREDISQSTCRESLGIEVEFVPDLAFLLDPQEPARPGEAAIGFTVREYGFPESTDPAAASDRYRRAIVKAIDELHRREPGLRVVFIPQVLDDVPIGAEIRGKLAHPERAEVLETDLSPEELMAVYGGLELLVATRLHSAILAIDAGTPPIHLVYEREKGLGVMRRLGLEEWTMRADALDGDELVRRILSLRAGRNQVRAQLQAALPLLRAEIRAAVADVVSAA
jgi:colanic acid/amylovoran biosynthesis protein